MLVTITFLCLVAMTVLDLPCRHNVATSPLNRGSVDMVVSWAGQSTPAREASKKYYLSEHENDNVDFTSARFAYNGELQILVRRAFVYGSPWLRDIHIVLPDACQHPDSIIHEALGAAYATLAPRVHIHRDSAILPATAVPCFSSHPKEANLDRIPGLSEKFVYANDDTFLNRSVPLALFFAADGTPLYRPDNVQPEGLKHSGDRTTYVGQDMYRCIQLNTATMFWGTIPTDKIASVCCIQPEHQVVAMSRSSYARARSRFPEAFAQLTQTRFRSTRDFSPVTLIVNLEIAAGRASVQTLSSKQVYIDVGLFPTAQRNLRILLGEIQDCDLLCLNNAFRSWHKSWIVGNFDIAAPSIRLL